MNSKVDAVISKSKRWKEEFEALRAICQLTKLSEELKWGSPCYTLDGKNVVLIQGFKEYCALLFFKGSLLKDPKKILVQMTENVQASRQIRFRSLSDVVKLKSIILSYVKEAAKLEKEGIRVQFKKTNEFRMPDEFKSKLTSDARLKKAFEALTPGRQRGYLLFFSQPKQSATRIARIEKSAKQILRGKGLND